MTNVITPIFGGGAGGGEPPPPTTLEEALAALAVQKELNANLRGMVLQREEEHQKLVTVMELCQKQIFELTRLMDVNQRVMLQSTENFKAFLALMPTK